MRIPSGIPVPVLVLCLVRMGVACARVDVIDAQASYPEGPMWDRGRLLYVEYAAGDIKTWDGKQSTVYWRREHCGPSALIHFRHDHILVACYDDNYLVELDAQGKEVATISRDSSGKPFVGPNDFTADGHGGIYFSASGVYDIKAPITGAVLHLSADGRDTREVAGTIHYSNGLTVSKDGRHLLVAEMLAGRKLSLPLQADGAPGAPGGWGIGRGAWWGRGENSVGGGSFKKKKKYVRNRVSKFKNSAHSYKLVKSYSVLLQPLHVPLHRAPQIRTSLFPDLPI